MSQQSLFQNEHKKYANEKRLKVISNDSGHGYEIGEILKNY